MTASKSKQEAIAAFRDHVSSEKAAFFEKYGMDFVMGKREGPYFWDMDGEKKIFDCHTNGGAPWVVSNDIIHNQARTFHLESPSQR